MRTTVTLTLLGFTLLLMVGCEGRDVAQAQTVATSFHTISVHVHPENARVAVWNGRSDVAAVVESRGPVAVFNLPEGDYHYSVRATGYKTFEGTFNLPRNRNLEVWLSGL